MQWIALLLTSFLGFANEPANLLEVIPRQEKQGFVTELKFDKAVQAETLNVQFINETVQVDIPGVLFPSGPKSTKVSNPLVKNVYTYQMENDTIRSRIIYKGVSADSFKDTIQVFADGNSLKLVVGSHPKEEAKAVSEVVAAAPIVSKEDEMLGMTAPTLIVDDKKEPAAASAISTETLVPNVADNSTATPPKMTAEEIAKKNENEIPVLASTGKKEVETSSNTKVLATLGILLITFLAGFVGIKKWSGKVGKSPKQTQIKVLTQHYLGPKRSLAIVRVAGESILI
ncbi:MAG: flagellar biosynthetic protein FliO, partial [Pseudobdellovibrionaceae bacterium]